MTVEDRGSRGKEKSCFNKGVAGGQRAELGSHGVLSLRNEGETGEN